jgi:hypothetical protein
MLHILKDLKENLRTVVSPENTEIRNAIPKKWVDISELIVQVNFAMIKSFYEKEYLNGHVDWNFNQEHKSFADWLEKVYHYITVEKPKLELDLNNAYPQVDITFEEEFTPEYENNNSNVYRMKSLEETYGKTYQEVYGEVHRIEALIFSKETEILTQMVQYRDHFWT